MAFEFKFPDVGEGIHEGRIVEWLVKEGDAVKVDAPLVKVDQSVVSRHLAQLREAGVLSAERRGKQVYYSVRVAELVRTLRAIADALERCCPVSDGRAQTTGSASAQEGSKR